MKPMRLMDRPEDYARLNVQPQQIQSETITGQILYEVPFSQRG